MLQFETSSRNAAESVRYGPTTGHRVVKDRLMRQEALVSFEEATSWSLLWHLHGKGSEELPEELILFPTTSYLEACQFVDYDHAVPFKHCPSLGSWCSNTCNAAPNWRECMDADIWPMIRAWAGENHGSQESDDSFLPGFNDGTSSDIFAGSSRSDYPKLACLNKKFKSLIGSGYLYKLRRRLGVIEHWVYLACISLSWIWALLPLLLLSLMCIGIACKI